MEFAIFYLLHSVLPRQKRATNAQTIAKSAGNRFILALIIIDGFIIVEEKGDPDSMVWLDGGSFTMGSDHGLPDEAPARPVSVSGFWIDKYEVTNAQYEAFVAATDYVTGAEQFGILWCSTARKAEV